LSSSFLILTQVFLFLIHSGNSINDFPAIALVFDVYILTASKWSKKLDELSFATSQSTKNS
jgi:hypothetical protein